MLIPHALLHPDEVERLATLRHYDFQATPVDDVFTDLVGLAAQLFSQPRCFLALVEEHQVSFPVLHGVALMPPVPRAQALCSSAILYPHAVVYENLATAAQSGPDALAIRTVLAQGGGFYAAAPLRMPDGRPIGVLCLVGPEAKLFGPAEQEVLVVLADVASLTIAVRHLCQATPELGPDQWENVRCHLRHDIRALRTHLGNLLRQYGSQTPVPAAVLSPVQRRLQTLRIALTEA